MLITQPSWAQFTLKALITTAVDGPGHLFLFFYIFFIDNKAWYSYMPYLTLWDKISQNLAPLEGNSHKKFKSHRIFRPFYNTFLWRNKHKSHTVVVFTSFLNENKDFRLYWGNSTVMFKKISQNFVKSPLKFCLISQILLHSLWHVWIFHVNHLLGWWFIRNIKPYFLWKIPTKIKMSSFSTLRLKFST